MSFNVIWSEFAEKQLDIIFTYYLENVNIKVAKKKVGKIISETNAIVIFPKITQLEELLKEREIEYRYLVCENHKIIYSIDFEQKLIKIADIFDTRQNPTKMKQLKGLKK